MPKDSHFGFEECTYLLLFGKLPNREEPTEFCQLLSSYRSLPPNFVRDVIMKKPSKDLMNTLARSVLTLFAYDDNPDDTSLPERSASVPAVGSACSRCCPSTVTRHSATTI